MSSTFDLQNIVAENVREIGEGAMRELKAENEALTRRVAELEMLASDSHDVMVAQKKRYEQLENEKAEADEHSEELATMVGDLQSQLTWTPVSDGLPEGETVLVRQSRSNGDYHIYGLLWNAGISLTAVTEEQPCELYEYSSSGESLRDWDEFRRVSLPEAT